MSFLLDALEHETFPFNTIAPHPRKSLLVMDDASLRRPDLWKSSPSGNSEEETLQLSRNHQRRAICRQVYADMGNGLNSKRGQCSCCVREGLPKPANSFCQNLKVVAGVNYPDPHCDENEMVAMTWSDNIPSQLPIEALFYFNRSGRDNSLAVSYAQYDQRRFKAETGKFLPIISLRLPNHYSGRATFMYFTSDQAITE